MYLKSLVLHGFKSFAQRVELEFSRGVSAIVGPNGSGKSNISDAIRWVLGEQNVRNLRGNSLADVIFAGTEQRRPLGMASVSLTLDNRDGIFPLPYAEVSITRRVYRSGESEFFINKTACRLKEIHELLLDTGLGRGSMAIIGQGEVDAVLSARPEQRRLLIEEVAGITRYRTKRKEAIERLQETEQHITRVEDILREVQLRLTPLAEEAERAKKYRQLRDRLREVEVTQLGQRWWQLRDACERLQKESATIAKEAEAHRERIGRLQQDRRQAEEQLRILRAEMSSLQQKVSDTQQARADVQTEVQVLCERRRALEERQERQSEAVERLEREYNESAAESARLQEVLQSAFASAQAAEAKARAADTELAAVKEGIEQREGALRRLREQALEQMRLRANAEARVERAVEEVRRAVTEVAEGEVRLHERQQEQRRLIEEQEQLTAQLATIREKGTRLAARLRENAAERSEVEQAFAVAQRERNRVQDAYQEIASRRKALLEIESSYEGYQEGVRACLLASEPWRPQVLGVVGSLFEASPEHEVAIEIALGGAMQHLVVADQATAEQAIAYLKQRRVGRVTFLPLDALRVSPPVSLPREAEQEAEVVGIGSDLITAPPEVARAVHYLLGRVLITQSLHGAVHWIRRIPGLSKAVSLDGDLVLTSGPMTGGHRRGANRGGGRLSRSLRIRELDAALSHQSEERRRYEEELRHLDERLQSLRATQAALQAELNGVRDEEAALLRQHDVLAARLEGVDKAVEQAAHALAEAQRRRERAEREGAEASDQLAHSTVGQSEAADELARLEAELSRVRAEREQHEERRNRERSAWIEATGAVKRCESELHRAKSELTRLEQARRHATDEATQLTAQLRETGERLQRAKAEVERLTAEVGSLQRHVSEISERVDSWQEQVERSRELEEQERARLDEVTQRHHKLQLATEREELALHQVEEELRSRQAEPPATTDRQSASSLRTLDAEAKALRAQLDELGDVHLGALDEYAALLEREQFLVEQLRDLADARADFERAVSELDATSRKRLQTTFDEIQAALQRIFPRLFGGGSARVEWTDPSNPLESGIDVIVRPKGKRPQPLMTLSGGERSLAATALLFAMMSVRPSPFFVLDEVDAALDEQNVSRFCDLLREFGQENQIIVITHRQTTMEAADTLFGVTMERQGASQILSLRLDDVATVS